jgi:hypothetical protein
LLLIGLDQGNLAQVVESASVPSTRVSSSVSGTHAIAPSAELIRLSVASDRSITRKSKIGFKLWTKADGPHSQPTKNRTWFHFSIEPVDLDSVGDIAILSFTVMNLNSVKKLFDMVRFLTTSSLIIKRSELNAIVIGYATRI